MSQHYMNAAGQMFPMPEMPLEPPDCWDETPKVREDWRNPSDETLKRFAEEKYMSFIEYIIGYDKTLLFDFAQCNKLDFKEFVEDEQ